jgi:UDP-3-O-[3-hydroxymyristoyl] glucosamine N-acyltransferase
MHLKASEIAVLVEGTLEGDPEILVTGAKGIAEAGPGDVAFVANPKYIDQIATSHAGVLLVTDAVRFDGRTLVRVRNPQLAFAKVLWLAYGERLAAIKPGIHPTAVIAATARIGENCTIGPYVVIEDNVTVGKHSRIMAHGYIGTGSSVGADCLIYPNVTVREECSIGSRVIIHSGTVIGSDGFGFVPGEKGHFKIPQMGIVSVGDDVEIGANVAIDRATTGVTSIGRGTKIDNLVHIAHNLHIGEHCFLAGQVGFAGSTTLGNFVSMGGQSAVAGHLKVGNRVTIAGKAGVTTNVPDDQIVSGFPARPHREELKLQALVHRLPELFEKIKKLKIV